MNFKNHATFLLFQKEKKKPLLKLARGSILFGFDSWRVFVTLLELKITNVQLGS
jgi:hypothetical protein